MIKNVSFAGVVLAGGESRRMGQDKSTLAWKGTSLLSHQARLLRLAGAYQLLLSGRAEQAEQIPGFVLVRDSSAGAGPAAAMADVWRETKCEVLLTLAVDLPRVPADYLRELALAAVQRERSVVPMRAGNFEPLAAAWHRSCLSEFSGVAGRSLQNICLTLVANDLLTPRQVSDGEAKLFDNVNTPEDYDRVSAATVAPF